MTTGTILLVEDEKEIADLLLLPIKESGFNLIHCDRLSKARETFEKERFSAILLDINLPDGNGIDFCREIRSKSHVPILMITAKRDEIDRILGLEFGADDYIVKPFSPREVTARIKAVLRRTDWDKADNHDNKDTGHGDKENILNYAGLKIDYGRQEVSVDGVLLSLTKTEFDLVSTFIRRPGMVFTRDKLIEQVWEGTFIQDRVVDSVISRLRRKLGNLPDGRPRIKTVHGAGYALTEVGGLG